MPPNESLQPTLNTERLALRPFTLGDAPAVQRLAGAQVIADTTLSIPHPYPDGDAETWIQSHAPGFAAGTLATFTIASQSDGSLMGAIGLVIEWPRRES